MTQWQQGDVLANGIRIHYYRTGGDGPPVVLCHGFSDNALCWTALARELETDYDVVMVDARFHGDSEVPRQAGDPSPDMAADLIGLIDALGLDRPVAVGHSMGASYVFYAAATYPDRLRAIALEDPVWFDPPPSVPEKEMADAMQRRTDERRAQIARYQTASFEDLLASCREEHPTWDDETRELFVRAKQQLSPRILDGAIVHRASWRALLAKVSCPLLVFTGDPSLGAIVTDPVYAAAEGLYPAMERAAIPGVGHHVRYENPEPYTAAMKAFLARIAG